MTLRFDWITTPRELDLLRDDWERLDDGSAPGAVFRSWDWQATWWRHLGDDPHRRRGLRVLVGRDESGVRGILPLYVEDAPVARLMPRRRAAFLADGTVGSDYLGLVAPAQDPVSQAALAGEFARRVAGDPMLADADLVELHDVLAGDALAEALTPALRERGWGVEAVPRYTCPYADLGGGDRDAWLAARKNGFGGQLREKRAKLEKTRGFDLTVAQSPDAVAAALEHLFTLHRARWAEHGSEAFTDARVEEFHRAAGRSLAERGFARVCVLSVAGEPVAAGYGFARAGRFAYYQAGLQPAWRARSAGTVVLGELVDRAFAERLVEFDFLRGEEPYKAIWADGRRTTASLTGHAPTARAQRAAGVEAAIRTIKRVARRALPESTVSRLRKAFR